MTKSIKNTAAEVLAAIGGREPVDARRIVKPAASSTPAGWEPRVRYEGGQPAEAWSPAFPDGMPEEQALVETLGLLAVNTPPGYSWILAEVKLDMGAWHRKEQGEDAVTKPTRRYRWTLVKGDFRLSDDRLEDLASAAIKAAGRKRAAVKSVPVTGRTLVVALADWQIGQADGDGVDGVVGRLAQIPAAVKAEVARLKRAGTPVDSVLLAGLGDLVEGCTNNWYSNQSFVVTLDRRQQVTIARRMLLEIVTQVAALGLPVTVTAVAGNHGENRSGGKVVTTYADNDDMAVFEQVADAIVLAESVKPGVFSNIKWSIHTDDRLVRTLDVNGHILGLTHGHLARTGGTGAAAKANTWWKNQSMAREAAGDADILLMGHYHHLVVQDMQSRWFLQAPALCDRSAWFAQSFGLTGKRGLLTFTVAAGAEAVSNIIVSDLDQLAMTEVAA